MTVFVVSWEEVEPYHQYGISACFATKDAANAHVKVLELEDKANNIEHGYPSLTFIFYRVFELEVEGLASSST